ncbi:MAG: hypothetical protein QM737_19205 [Ferruginibacter sp.]
MNIIYKINLRILITCFTCISFTSLKAQQDSTTYPVVIQFNSIGTGVPRDSALRSYITCFKKKYKVKNLTASRIGPMGKEGEYWLAFSLAELTKKQASLFRKQIKAVAEKKQDRGIMVYLENEKIDKNSLGRATMSDVAF